MTKILKLPDVMATTGLSRSSIYAFIKEGRFPKPIPIGMRAVGWLENEIFDWIHQKSALRKDAK